MKRLCPKKIIKYFIAVILVLFLVVYLIVNPIFIYQRKPNNVFIDKNALSTDVKILISINPPRNYLNINSLNKAADYIFSEFEKTGCELDVQKFIIDEVEYKNIICSFGTKNNERLVVGAHYDVYADTPGADDNATGIAGILELARVLVREKPNLKYGIDLVAYTLEEPPFFRTENMGSSKHAQYLKEDSIKVAGMICLEMIGFYSDKVDSQNYPIPLFKMFYPNKGNFIAVIGKLGQQGLAKKVKRNIIENSNINAQSINTPTIIKGMDFSDHLNYWNRGYDAVMITDTSFYRNSNYHLGGDTFETLNFERMGEVIKGVYFTIINI